ncbi:LRR_TYP [Nesidiocoris tenuis]|uniref:LRR_TYP n=1 Tax=Nesidiocoris tenuis TaxID=355587 RepID=A0ABN7AB88_9HEMI|nr:LRR_TYP [Nesidiocoris tenuis]
MLRLKYLVLASLMLGWRTMAIPCNFNPMCSCRMSHSTNENNKTSITDISCAGVPFSRLPDFPGSKVSHIDIVGSGLEVVEADSLASTELLSVRFISNSISLFSLKALQ